MLLPFFFLGEGFNDGLFFGVRDVPCDQNQYHLGSSFMAAWRS